MANNSGLLILSALLIGAAPLYAGAPADAAVSSGTAGAPAPLVAAAAVATAAVTQPLSIPVKGSLDLDINYPGAALRYFVDDGKGLELVGQGQDHIFTGVLRYYYYPKKLARGPLCPYLAAEGDFITFKGRYSKGNGWGGGLAAGTEYRLSRAFSVQADLGATYISVKDKDTSLVQGGLEFIINLGVNIYFGERKP